MSTILKILERIGGIHLLRKAWRDLGGDHLQATIEGLAWRGVVVISVYLYNESPTFKAGLDQIIKAVSGGPQ